MTTQRQMFDLRDGLLRQSGRSDAYLPVVAPVANPPAGPATGATDQLGR